MGRRQQSDAWIHRWSRPLIAGVAGLGALETGYLTVVKLTGAAAVCPTAGCQQVLSSPYAMVGGLPLSLFGFLAYTAMAGLALLSLRFSAAEHTLWRSQLEEWTWLLLFGGATAMVIFSGYLMYVLAAQIQVLCLYCLFSALLTVLLLGLTLGGRAWPDWGQLLFSGIVIGVVALTGTLGVYAQASPPQPAAGIAGPAVTQSSGPAELELAEHLQRIGAKMYGAYWCPHCHDQKQLFGQAAAAKLTYIECDRAGQNAQPERCQAAGITGYPTWEIKGRLYSGTQSLPELARLSDYRGSQDFQNRLPNR